jgi:DNA invertase Pin-like site-specific DNA recombinase
MRLPTCSHGPAPAARPMKKTAKRAALYVRVSTLDKQHPANQITPLQKWSKQQGYPIVATFIDRETGASSERPKFKAMMEAAAQRQFEIIICWSLDRFTREGIAETFIHLRRLQQNGVQFYSLTEEYFRTTGPAGDFLIAVTAWVADHERRRRQERIRAGLARARDQGIWIGRRPNAFIPAELIEMKKMAAAGVSLRAIAIKFKTSKSTIARRLNAPERKANQRLTTT